MQLVVLRLVSDAGSEHGSALTMLRIAGDDVRFRNGGVDHLAEGSPHGRKAGISSAFVSRRGQEPYGAGVAFEDLVDGFGRKLARAGRTSSGSTRAISAPGTLIRLTTAGSRANAAVSSGLNSP